MTLTSGAVNARPAPAAPVSACGTGHTIAALYVNPDGGTYQIRYGLTGPPYGQYEPQAGHPPGGERVITLSADADEARMLALTWPETARAIRPYLPGLPPAALEAYARALLAEAGRHAFDYRLRGCSAPCLPRHDYYRALITSAREALSHGDPPAAIRQVPGGAWEVSETDIIISIPAVLPRKQDNPSTTPARRAALRLVQDGH